LIEGSVPDAIKIAKVVPIHKGSDKQYFNNYRPISILPSISKIYERVIYKRLYFFLEQNSILYDGQYGFRPKRSTIDAVHDFVSNIHEAFECKKHSLGVFLDLLKAFDTINHNILLTKLSWYGIRGKALDWFRSYLSNRKHYIKYGDTDSDQQKITHGVPQGSILGPLLFLIYVNDLPSCLNYSKPVLFADDTSICHAHQNMNILVSQINSDLNNLNDWFKSNKMSLNISKTHYIIFKAKTTLPTNTINIGGIPLMNKTSTIFLGMHIDDQLNWHNHILHVQKKLNSSLYALNRAKNLLNTKNLKILYYALIDSHISYGLTLWGGSHQSYVNRVITQQKKAIRNINKLKYNEHTNEHFYTLGILKLKELF
jgi:hypothetical protein